MADGTATAVPVPEISLLADTCHAPERSLFYTIYAVACNLAKHGTRSNSLNSSMRPSHIKVCCPHNRRSSKASSLSTRANVFKQLCGIRGGRVLRGPDKGFMDLMPRL
ncbi:hypothetical protein VTH06DRAFT_6972 [Thermothelomyces fergusii]